MKVIAENLLYPPCFIVWCGFWANGVIGLYVFENEDENAMTGNGERYKDMIREQNISQLMVTFIDSLQCTR